MTSSTVSSAILVNSSINSGFDCFGPKDGRKIENPAPQSRPEQINATQGSPALEENFSAFNEVLWGKADGWANEAPFNCGWARDHATFEDGKLILKLNDMPSSNTPYTSAEYRSTQRYSYGSLEASIKAANGSGLVTSLFFYTGPSEGEPWDEIDVEILGKDTTKMQTNYITNGVGSHEVVIDLRGSVDPNFDASKDYHTYRIDWKKDKIVWYVDGKQVHVENGSKGPLPSHDGRIIMNLWPGKGVDKWLGPYDGRPNSASYDWLKYTSFTNNADVDRQKPEASSAVAEPLKKTSNKVPLTGLKAVPFNGASGRRTADAAEFSGSAYDDGMVLFEDKELEGNFMFSWIFKEGTNKDGPFKIVFIDSNGQNTGETVVEPDANKDQSIEIPKGTTKVNIMASGSPVAVKLSGFSVSDK